MSKYKSNGNYVLEKLLIYSYNSKESKGEGKAWDLMPSFSEISLFESLTDSVMTGYVAVADSENVRELMELHGMERIELSFHTAGAEEQRIDFIGVVYKISERIRLTEHTMGYKISFCSEALIKSERSFVQRAYEGNVHDIVVQIYEEYLRGLDDKNIEIVPTEGIHRYTFGTLRPIDSINIMLRDSYSVNNEYGYVFYEDNEKFNYKPLQMLYLQEPVARYVHRLPGVYDDVNERAQEQFESIQAINYSDEVSLLDRIADGVYGSSHIYFDITTKQYMTHRYDTISEYDEERSLGNSPVQRELEIGDDVVFMNYVSNNMPMTIQYTRSLMKMIESETFKANITVFGDSSLKVGEIIEVFLPRLSSNEEIENPYQGKMLISAIRHTMDRVNYMQELEVVKDAFVKE